MFNKRKENIPLMKEKIENPKRLGNYKKVEILKLSSISEIKYPLGRVGKSRMEIIKKSVRKQENQSIDITQSKEHKKQLRMPSRTQLSQMTPQPHPIRSLKFYSLKGKTKGFRVSELGDQESLGRGTIL